MPTKAISNLTAGLLLALCLLGTANASFIVEQYDDFQSSVLAELQHYADSHEASTTAAWDYIDFTDDPGFQGYIAGSNLWPSAYAQGATGANHPLNTTFFARITGDVYISAQDDYTFRTINDDGLFLLIDGNLVINDNIYHAEETFQQTLYLSTGFHSVELFFFENSGEASLEFTIAQGEKDFTHFNDPAYRSPVPEPATLTLLGVGILGLAGIFRKKEATKKEGTV